MANKKVRVGSSEMVSSDLPDLMEWLESRLKQRGASPPEAVYLCLLAAECYMLLLKKDWIYEEPVDVFFAGLRVEASRYAVHIVDAGEMFDDGDMYGCAN